MDRPSYCRVGPLEICKGPSCRCWQHTHHSERQVNYANWLRNNQPAAAQATCKQFGPFYYWRVVDIKGGVARQLQLQLPSIRMSFQFSFKRHGY
jgi:hypothetical protein